MEPGRGLATLFVCMLTTVLGAPPGDKHNILNLVTFNTNLAFPDPTAQGRLGLLQEGFTSGRFGGVADVMCMQELQEVEHQKMVRAAARSGKFTSSLSFLDTYDTATLALLANQPACNAAKFAVLGQCIDQSCNFTFSQHTRIVLDCVVRMCGQLLRSAGLSQECINCVNALGVAGISGQESCFSVKTKLDYRPTYGLLMLSKYPLVESVSRTFRDGASFFSRGYLRATVKGGTGIGDWTAVCTHLYPSLSGVGYIGAFSSSEEENLNNTMAMISDHAVGTSERVVVMGDMNHGPANSANAVTAEFPKNYQAVLNASYCSPYAEELGQCTFCGRTNPFLLAVAAVTRMPEPTEILDHVYLKAPFFSCRNGTTTNLANIMATRRFTELTPLGVPLSDHYGIQVSITVPAGDSSTTAGLTPPPPLLLLMAAVACACTAGILERH